MRLYVLLATVIAATLVATGNALTDAQDESKITTLRKATTTADIATADSLAERLLVTNELESEEERGRKKRRRRRWFRRSKDNEDEVSDDGSDDKHRRRRRHFYIF
ncbi:hypothetical protein JG688_00009447 [Phytophthora aleatoria]|uniref:RxLR effector protein n=1 Tax=Phytophthora aleatoria TaxID=2496075 RepID=A0A8J5M402_9STRA|nr:hypothetical protein JG688_00009447 [Phytophthora aleatoria]